MSINIPANVSYIGESAFHKCSSLNGVFITDIAAWCRIEFAGSSSNPLSVGNNLYLNGKSMPELVIPQGITKINSAAFEGCTSIKSLVIPEGVLTIGQGAFFGCTNLTSVTVPQSLVTIEGYAFARCESLAKFTVTKNVRSIGERAFGWCMKLENITFEEPNGWTTFDENEAPVTLTDLADRAMAAGYLKSIYNDAKWTRK
jgi:hypothetical protein